MSRWIMLGMACGLAIALGTGCGSKSYDRYVPSEDAARKALEAALSAWQEGRRVGPIESTSPKVQVVDSKWAAGQKLRSYEILEAEPGNGPKWFSVRLTLDQSAEKQVVKYVVVGQGPVWVYREEDFKSAEGMHNHAK